MTSSISGNMSFMQMHRPDPTKMATKLFSKLDTQNKGYLEKSDLQSAFDGISGKGKAQGSASVDDVFTQLDSDGDGKITKDEMSSGFSKLAEQLDGQFNNMRMHGFGGRHGTQGMGDTPPPPPPQDGEGGKAGFTKDELTSQLDEIGSSDSKRSQLISEIINNFDKADTDGDGKVSMKEAMAYDKANSSSTASGSSATASSTSSGSEAAVMKKIMQLMHAYGGMVEDSSQSGLAGLLSASA